MLLINEVKEGWSMGFLFGRKKKEKKHEVISISGTQLCDLLTKAVSLATEDVEAKCYSTGPEIMFEYNGNVHFMGIKYDKKRAKTEKRITFSNELMTVYIDKQSFSTVEESFKISSARLRSLIRSSGFSVATILAPLATIFSIIW